MEPAISKSTKKTKGQSLIEVLIALAIVAMVILGIVKASTFSVSNSLYSQDQSIASNLAQKKTSEIISLKNSFPLTFFDTLPSYPDDLSDDSRFCTKTTLTSADDEIPSGSPVGSRMAKIEVIVFWGEEGDGFDCTDKQYRYQFNLETKTTNN